MSTINLKCDRLREYIRKTLEIEKYGEPFSTLIEEVFVRQQYHLELSPKELYEDLINFKNSINIIRFDKIDDNCMAYTDSVNKEIVFNIDYWQNMINTVSPEVYCKKFFETLAHESLHGMQNTQDKNGNIVNRAGGYNSNVKNRAHAIYEICTQAIAAKLTYDRDTSEIFNNNILTGDGYTNEIFAVSLIASTFGVTEKEVLKYGVRPRDELIKILDKNIGDYQKTSELLEQIENQLEYMHSIYYPDNNQEKFKRMTLEQKQKATTDIILNLVKLCQQVFVVRIKNTSLDFNKNIDIQYKYDQKKMLDTLAFEFANYSHNFDRGYSEFFYISQNDKNADYIRDALKVFEQIAKDKIGNLKAIAPMLVNAVKTGNFKFCEEQGISFIQDNTYSLVDDAVDFKHKRAHEDYNDFRLWDNRKIFKAIYPSLQIDMRDNPNKLLDSWSNIYTSEGMQKINDLRIALNANKEKYGLESKQQLLIFMETPEYEMDKIYTDFTRHNNAREIFSRSFKTDSDKEFLARLIAEKYIDKAFANDNSPKELLTENEREVQEMFMPTIQKRGREQLVWSIAQVFINDYYQAFSDDGARMALAISGKKRLFDIISQPLLDELLNQRRIIPEKNTALQKTIFVTEQRHPDTTATRLSIFIDEYRNTGMINTSHFSREGREYIRNNFQSQRDMEDFVGIICDGFSRNCE